jgi:hypothetical protein
LTMKKLNQEHCSTGEGGIRDRDPGALDQGYRAPS